MRTTRTWLYGGLSNRHPPEQNHIGVKHYLAATLLQAVKISCTALCEGVHTAQRQTPTMGTAQRQTPTMGICLGVGLCRNKCWRTYWSCRCSSSCCGFELEQGRGCYIGCCCCCYRHAGRCCWFGFLRTERRCDVRLTPEHWKKRLKHRHQKIPLMACLRIRIPIWVHVSVPKMVMIGIPIQIGIWFRVCAMGTVSVQYNVAIKFAERIRVRVRQSK